MTLIKYEVETVGRRRKSSFVKHVSKMKLFHDQNELYVDLDDADAAG